VRKTLELIDDWALTQAVRSPIRPACAGFRLPGWLGGTIALLAALSGAGCGSRSAGDTDALSAAMTDDAAPSQRGPVDSGSGASDTRAPAPDVATADLRPPDSGAAGAGGGGDAGPRDAAAPDTTSPVDAPVAQCAAPAKRCDGKNPQICDSNGQWQNGGAACPFVCSAGACTGVCVPGGFQCNATGTTQQICGATGLWTDYLACPFVCLGTSCGGTCFPGRSQCVAGDVQTCSAMGAWQSTGVASRELLVNGSFDDGETGWKNDGVTIVFQANGTGNGNSRPSVSAQSAPNVAWFGGVNRDDHQLTQGIAIPAGAVSVTLSFYYFIVTNELTSGELDTLDIAVVTAGNDVIPLAHLSDNNETQDWTHFTAALPPSLAGQTVTLQIHVQTSAILVTSFYVDTMSVQAVACPGP
jgi:hypothetical protein